MKNFPRTTTLLAFGALGIFAFVLVMLFLRPVPEENRDTLNLALGALFGWVSACVTFYFGDTKKGQQQADTITTLASSAAVTASAANDDSPAPGERYHLAGDRPDVTGALIIYVDGQPVGAGVPAETGLKMYVKHPAPRA